MLYLLQRERNTSYQRRWFVLKGNLLFYQDRPADRHLLGVIVLEGCIVRPNPTEGQFCFSLAFTGPGLRTYWLAAENCLSQESWVHALYLASHTCLSLLVKELGRLYEGKKHLAYFLLASNWHFLLTCNPLIPVRVSVTSGNSLQ